MKSLWKNLLNDPLDQFANIQDKIIKINFTVCASRLLISLIKSIKNVDYTQYSYTDNLTKII